MFYQAETKLNNNYLAKEIVRDIFADIWARRSTINLSESFAAYIAVATKYEVITAHAKQKTALKYIKHLTLTITENL